MVTESLNNELSENRNRLFRFHFSFYSGSCDYSVNELYASWTLCIYSAVMCFEIEKLFTSDYLFRRRKNIVGKFIQFEKIEFAKLHI